MPGKLVWNEKQNFQGFGCSECNWMFQPSSALLDESLDRMKEKYEAQRDKEFAAHVCVKRPGAARPRRNRPQRSFRSLRDKLGTCETKSGSKHLKTAEE